MDRASYSARLYLICYILWPAGPPYPTLSLALPIPFPVSEK